MEFLIEIWPYILDNANLFLFLGMLVGGETFFLPAVYLSVKGTLNFSDILFFAVLATIISDTAWYALGRFFSLEKILSCKIFLKKREEFAKIFGAFKKHSQKLLYISKFVYGTRTLVQIFSGAIRMPFLRYSAVNIAGIISYLFGIALLAILTKESLVSLEEMLYYEYVYIAVFILVVGIIHICLKKWLGKNFTASSFQPGMKSEQSKK